MKRIVLSLSIAVAGSLSLSGVYAADAEAGKAKTATCVACHGVDGNSVVPAFPKIAEQNFGYLKKQMAEFKDGRRNDPTMEPIAKVLSEQDIDDIALYYSKQKRTMGKTDPAALELGAKIFKGGDPAKGVSACIACHGPRGNGIPSAKYPKISGQYAAYTEKQLKNFKTGFRHNDPNHDMMQDIAKKMSDEDIKAVSSYVEGLH